MADLRAALADFGKDKEQGFLNTENSASVFAEHLANGSYDASPEEIEHVRTYGNLNEFLTRITPPDPDNYDENTLSKIANGLAQTNDANLNSENYLKSIVDRISNKDEKRDVKAFLKNGSLTTVSDILNQNAINQNQRISSIYTEGLSSSGEDNESTFDFLSGVIDDFKLSSGIDDRRESLSDYYDTYKIATVARDKANRIDEFLQSDSVEDLVKERREEAIELAGLKQSSFGAGVTDENLITALNSAKERLTQTGTQLDNIQAENSNVLKNVLDQVEPLINGSLQQESRTDGENIILNSKGVGETLVNVKENPGSFVRILAKEGQDLVEQVGAGILGAIGGGVTAGPAGALSGASVSTGKVSYENAFDSQLPQEIKKLLDSRKLEPTRENIRAVITNADDLLFTTEQARKFAIRRATSDAISAGVGSVAGTTTGVLRRSAATLAAGAVDVVGGKVSAESVGDKYTSTEATLDFLVSGIETAGIATGSAVSTARSFKAPNRVDNESLNRAADLNTNTNPEAENKYDLTPGQLVQSGLVKPIPEGVDINAHVKDPDSWVGDLTYEKFKNTPAAQDQAFQRVAEINVDQAYAAKVLTTDSTPEQVSGFVNAAHKNGVQATIRFLDDGIDSTGNIAKDIQEQPSVSTESNIDRNSPALTLVDNQRQSDIRNQQREALRFEPNFRKAFLDDTNGTGSETAYNAAQERFIQSRLSGDELTDSYAAAAIGYRGALRGKAKKEGELFAKRLDGLARQVDVIDDTQTGQTGITTRFIIDSLENPDSNFYTRLSEENPSLAKFIRKQVSSGDLELTVNALREVGIQNSTYRDTVNAMADQLSGIEVEIDPKLQSKASQFAQSDVYISPDYYSGRAIPEYDGSVVSAIEVLNSAQGRVLRNELGTVEKVQSIIGDVPVASEVARIVNSSATSSKALSDLAELDIPELNSIVQKAVEERSTIDNNIGTDLFETKISAKIDDPSAPLDTNTNDIRPELIKERVSIPDDRQARILNERTSAVLDQGIIRRSFNKVRETFQQQLTSSRGLKDLDGNAIDSDIAVDNVDAPAIQEADIEVRGVKLALKNLGVKLNKDVDSTIDKYLKGDTETPPPSKMVQLLERMQSVISRGSEEIIEALIESERVSREAGGSADYSKTADTIRENIGTYLTRSYRAFTEPKAWARRISSQSVDKQNAIKQLAESDNISIDEAAAKVNELIAGVIKSKGDAIEFFTRTYQSDDFYKGQTSQTFDSSTNSILKRRLNVPPWIRTLLGEETGGLANYGNTILKQRQLLYTIQKENALVDFLNDAGVISGKGGIGLTQVTPSSPLFNRFSAMNNIFIEDANYSALINIRNNSRANPEYQAINAVNGFYKADKLLLNPGSYVNQYYGAGMIGAAHLLFEPVTLTRAIGSMISMKQQIKSGDTAAVREDLVAMSKSGVLESDSLAELTALLSSTPARKNIYRKTVDQLGRIFGAPDRTAKVIGYFANKDTATKAIQYDVDNGLLPPDTDVNKLAIQEAAKLTSDFFPTPNKSFELIKGARRPRSVTTLVGNQVLNAFATHSAEVPRNLLKTAQYVGENVRSDNPVRRNKALRLIAGFGLVVSGQAIRRIQQDDEFDFLDNQASLPTYLKGQQLINGYVDEIGNLRYNNIETSDSFSMFTSIIKSLLNPDQSMEDTVRFTGKVLENTFLGGGAVREMYDAYQKNVKGNTPEERGFNRLVNVSKAFISLPVFKLGKEIYDLENSVDSPENRVKLENAYKKIYRQQDVIINPVDFWRNTGRTISESYNDRALRDMMLSKKTDPNIDKIYNEFKNQQQIKLDNLWAESVNLNKHLESVRDKVEPRIVGRMLSGLSSKSGIKKEVIARILRLRQLSPEKPTLEEVGLLSAPNVETKSLFKDTLSRQEQELFKQRKRLLDAHILAKTKTKN